LIYLAEDTHTLLKTVFSLIPGGTKEKPLY